MSTTVSIADPDQLAIVTTKSGFTPEAVVGIARERLVSANAG